MGMFDTVLLDCPYCKEEIEEQTKSGDCMLDTYTLKDVPMNAAAGILGPVQCYKCAETFIVEAVTKPTYRVRKQTEADLESEASHFIGDDSNE